MMKQAIILAAGEGQRLRPFTVNRPKTMLAIADKPIVQYVIEALSQNGIRNIVLVVGYRKEQIFDSIGSGEEFGVDVTYVTQNKQLGTAHALAQAVDVAEAEFLVLPGDNLIVADTIARFIDAKPGAVLVKRVADPSRYGVVSVKQGMVQGIEEKPGEARSNLVNTGVYAFNREIFEYIESILDIPDVLNSMIAKGRAVNAVETDGSWLDVVYPWDILNLNAEVLDHFEATLGGTVEPGVSLRGQVTVGKDTVLHANSYISGPVIIGSGCHIGPNVCILPATSIGDNVVISSFTEVKNSVIGNDVAVGPGCIIEDSVIDAGCVIKGHLTACSGEGEVKVNGEPHSVGFGVMMGEGCSVGGNVVIQPGTIIGTYCQIQAMKLVAGKVPDKGLVY